MSRPVAFTDANVIYAAAARDLLVELAIAKAIALRWSDAVHEEWTAALARSRPNLDPLRIQRTRRLLTEALPDAMVADYEPVITALQLPDDGDRHVLAAAIKGGCQLILTFNLMHFPTEALAPHGMVAIHPDVFLSTLYAANPLPVIAAASRIRARLVDPAMPPAAYLLSLAHGALPSTAQALRAVEDQI